MNTTPAPDRKAMIRRLMIFIALVSIAEGMGQVGGVINQPLVYFFKQVLHWEPDQVTRYISWLIVPWIIKPVYVLLSDNVPIFGFRRRPYLIMFTALAVGAFVWMTHLLTPVPILIALFLSAFGMAGLSTITEAVTVKNGNKAGVVGKLLNEQWLLFSISGVAASLAGGWLADKLNPGTAFHTACWIAAVLPLGVIAGSWFLVDEDRGIASPNPIPNRRGILSSILGSRTFWLTALFLFVWNIVPSFGTPLFYDQVDRLKYSQYFIGVLSAVGAGGSVLGSLCYVWLSKKMNLQKLLYLSLALGTLANLAFLFMHDHTSAILIYIFNGICGMIALVASLTVAAHNSPDKSAGLTYALLMSVNNLAGQLASNIGAWLFVHMFHAQLAPLIWVAAIGTAACVVTVPMMKLGDTRGDELMERIEHPLELAKAGNVRFGSDIASGF